MRRTLLVLWLSLGGATWAQEDAPASLDLGPVLSRAQVGSVLYLGLARGGVAVVDVADASHPKLTGRLLEGHVASQLVVEGGQLMVLEVREEAHRFALSDPLHPVATTFGAPRSEQPVAVVPGAPFAAEPIAPVAAGAAQGKVVELKGGRILFAGGTSKGFVKGAHVRVISQQPVAKPDLSGAGTVEVPSGEVTAVVAIEQAEANRAMAQLGRGDVAFVGDLVEPTSEPLSERLALPRRSPYAWRFGFQVRPFLGLEATSKPVGILADAFVAYTFPSVPFTLMGVMEPLGVAFNSTEQHYPLMAAVLGAYTTDYFEIGLGVGALAGNKGPCTFGFDPQTGQPTNVQTCEVNTGLTINQTVRLGALDGLHVEWHSSIFSRPDKFVFGVGRAELAVPLTSRLSLFGGGGGGENGWNFGELGVRTFVSGTGAPGTIIFSASIGYASIFDGPQREVVGGPSVAFGAEWRR